MQAVGVRVDRLADLWWLLAHDERGRSRVGGQHFATGLAAALLGEVLMQPSARVVDSGDVMADPAVTVVLAELNGAAREGLARPIRVWVEWLSDKESNRLCQAVTTRMIASGLLIRQGHHVMPVDGFTAFTPVTALLSALSGTRAVSDPVRLLGGIAMACGLAPLVSTSGEDMVWPLQQMARGLPKPFYSLVLSIDDVIHTVATRRR